MKYNIKVLWENNDAEAFTNNKYNRAHKWFFDSGIELQASSSPQVVPLPMSDEMAVDPEEAFVASLASCHMLFFLSIASAQGYIINKYEDHAEGLMGKNEQGQTAITTVNLNPLIIFSGSNIPTSEQVSMLHGQAHSKCFIANSVRSKINIYNH